MTDHNTTPSLAQAAEAIDLVRRLLLAGLVDPAALGPGLRSEATRSHVTPGPDTVPGARISLTDLAAKTKELLSKNTLRTYGGYIDFLCDGWTEVHEESGQQVIRFAGLGHKWADEVLPTDLERAALAVRQRAEEHAAIRAQRRVAVGRAAKHSDGTGAVYNAVGAWRRMFRVAVKDRHLSKDLDPAQEVRKPKRPAGPRHALTERQLAELWHVLENTGDDPELDLMLCKTILLTGARREGLLNLTLDGLDLEACTVRLDEKFGKVVDQPAPRGFVRELYAFAVARGAQGHGDSVFRKAATARAGGSPISSRRLDNIFSRVQSHLEWADKMGLSAHWLRHHATATIERASSRAVSTRFARHEPESVNDNYTKASLKEVIQAVIDVYGGEHPLLEGDGS